MLPGGSDICVTQDPLNHIIGNTEFSQVGSQATAKGMPAVPLESVRPKIRNDLPLGQVVHAERFLAS